MKDIQHYKDSIAKEHGYEDWYDTYSEPIGFEEREKLINEAMKRYAEDMCKEQRVLCADNMEDEVSANIYRQVLKAPLATDN